MSRPTAESRARAHSLRVDVPGEQAALDLIERLGPLHAELAPNPGGCCRVRIEVRPRPGDRVLHRVLDIVADWAARYRLETARLELDGRELVVSASPRTSMRVAR